MSGVILNSFSNEFKRTNTNAQNDGNISDSGSEIESNPSVEISKKSTQEIKHQPNGLMITTNKNICLPNFSQSTSQQHISDSEKTPNIGSVTVQNSSHTMFGNKNIYNAPVTINNFLDDNISTKYKFTSTYKMTIACIVIITALISSLFFALKFILASDNNAPSLPPIFESLKFVSRDEWTALQPKSIIKLDLPADRVIIGHTVTPICYEESSCVAQMRSIQRHHMFNLNCSDIGYNFLIGGDGAVYIARGWDRQGEHTYASNVGSIGIGIIGSFNDKAPPKHQLDTTQKLIALGVELKKVREDYNLYGQRQLTATESPGHELYKIILKWKNWKNKTEPVYRFH